MKKVNILLEKSLFPFNAIPFDQIVKEDFLPAIEIVLEEAKSNLSIIEENEEIPTFENTIVALCDADLRANEISAVYGNLYALHSTDDFKEIAEKLFPLETAYSSELFTNPKLFKRVQFLFQNRSDIGDIADNQEKIRLLTKIYDKFIRTGALLGTKEQNRVKDIDQRMVLLTPDFSKRVLAATNGFSYSITDEVRLKGLPDFAVEVAKQEADKREVTGWVFTLQPPSLMSVLSYAVDREFRKGLYLANSRKNIEGEHATCEIVSEIVALREERARLLGFANHAGFVLDQRMAKTPECVLAFLDDIFQVARPVAERELEAVKLLAFESDGILPDDFQNWDLAYYGNKLKQKLFDYDPEDFRPYFKAEKVIDGIFAVAKKLYGIDFIPRVDLPIYHEEVRVFEVQEMSENEGVVTIGLLYVDLYPRETKQGGAWMSCLKTQGRVMGVNQLPHIVIAGNLTPSTLTKPSLLSLSDANTLFHEFGHAFHGLLSDVSYSALASPNVFWDFVELPSQIMENWLMEKETLDLFASHYVSGEKLPVELIERAKSSESFNAGLFNLRQLSLGYLDMMWHTQPVSANVSPLLFEESHMAKFKLLPDSGGAFSPSFAHIFAGGYSAGYYSYKWAELLDADAFELFKERGIFDPETAKKFRTLLACGNSVDPMELYVAFRGQKPDPMAILRRDGLV